MVIAMEQAVAETRQALIRKLRPDRFSAMSGKMAAIVGYVLGVKFSDPELVEMCVTSDGIVLATREGDCGMNEWIGSKADLERNWRTLLDVAELTDDERELAETLYGIRILMW